MNDITIFCVHYIARLLLVMKKNIAYYTADEICCENSMYCWIKTAQV